MPKKSDKQLLMQDLEQMLNLLILSRRTKTGTFKSLLQMYEMCRMARVINPIDPVPKFEGLTRHIFEYPPNEFKQIVRMSKETFRKILPLISGHPVFHSNSQHKQPEAWVQLAVVLELLGADGNGASVGRFAREAGVSVGTIVSYKNRVFTAILAIKDQFVQWPNQVERQFISERFDNNYGIPGAVGIVDGTHIYFSQKPHIDGEVYFSRKCRYSMNVQLICDDKRLIRYYQIGHPGSRFDSTVFGESSIMRHPNMYFSPNQFLLADAGYGLGTYVCTPYRQPAANIPANKQFNELFSSARVTIEHVNGILKGRFSSLRGIRTQIKKKEDLLQFCNHIVVCIVLYNMTQRFGDLWTEEDQEINGNLNNNINANDGNSNLRQRVQAYLLQWHINNQ